MRIIAGIALASVIGVSVVFYGLNEQQDQQTPKDDTPSKRAAWMKKRLQDPSTGEIPVGIFAAEHAFARTLPHDGQFASRSKDSLVYEKRGPFNVGGRMRAIAADIKNPSVLIAGAVSGGVWRSDNGGLSWSKRTLQDQNHMVSCIVQDTRPGKEHIWYLGTGEGEGRTSAFLPTGNGIYKSTDGGLTWNPLASTVTNQPTRTNAWNIAWRLAVDPSNTSKDEVYAAMNGSIFKSTDGGATWRETLGTGGNGNNYTWVKVTSTGIVYAAIGNTGVSKAGIWRSTDGDNWTVITPSNMPGSFQRVILDVAPSNENILYVLANTPGAGQSPGSTGSRPNEGNSLFKYTYISGDGSGSGGVWENRSTNIPTSNTSAYETFDSQGGYNMLIKVHPTNENTLFIGGTNLFRSTNGFANRNATVQMGGYNTDPQASFDEYRYPNQHPDQHDMIFPNKNSNAGYVVTDGGVSYSSDLTANKVVYQFRNFGFASTQFYTVALDHLTDNGVLVGGTQDNGTQFTYSTSPTTDFTSPAKGDGSYCAVQKGSSMDGSGIYYFSSQNGVTYKAEMGSNGVRLRFEQMNPPGIESNFSFINPFTVDYNNHNVMYVAYRQGGSAVIKRHLALSSIPMNNNRNPSSVGWHNLPGFSSASTISCLKTTRSNPTNRLYVGTQNRRIYRIDNASGTPTVKEITISGLYQVGQYVSDIAVHPTDGNKVMVTFSNYGVYSIYYSEDGGDNWIGLGGNLEDELGPGMPTAARGQGNGPSVNTCAIVDAEDGPVYYVGTSTGLYACNKLDGDNTVWIAQGYYNIGNVSVHKLDVRDVDDYLAIATYGAGLYGCSVSSAEAVTSTEEVIRANDRIRVFPNPAVNNSTNLEIELEEAGMIRVDLIDQMGRWEGELFSSELPAGSSTVQLDLTGIPHGIHYCRIQGGQDTDKTIKLLVQ